MRSAWGHAHTATHACGCMMGARAVAWRSSQREARAKVSSTCAAARCAGTSSRATAAVVLRRAGSSIELGWAYVEPSWVCLVPAIELGELGVQQRAGVGASWHSQLMQRSGRIQGGDCNAYWSRSRHAPRSTGQLYASVPLSRWSLRLPDASPALIEGGFNPRRRASEIQSTVLGA